MLGSEDGVTMVAEAADGLAAVELTREHRPDVVLMDVRMPVLDGIAATREIVARRPETRVLILTTFDLDEYASLLRRRTELQALLRSRADGENGKVS